MNNFDIKNNSTCLMIKHWEYAYAKCIITFLMQNILNVLRCLNWYAEATFDLKEEILLLAT